MTGKEDLFTYEEVSRLAKRMEEELIETRQELAKYKRAFEILKDTFTLICYEGKKYYLLSDLRNEIKKEEAELLEELMNNEN